MPLHFRPDRDSRHRRVGFSLYRALVRQGRRVPIPPWLSDKIGTPNPFDTLVKNGFRRNREDTSPRLVVSALKSGYRFLSMLHTAAENPAGPEHAQVVDFVSDNYETVGRRERPRFTKPPTASSDRKGPLTLVQEATDTSPPVYRATSRPLPLEQLSGGVRKVPVLDDYMGFPFLRFSKPQKGGLSNALTYLSRKRISDYATVMRLRGEGVDIAREEDRWEGSMRELARENGIDFEQDGGEASYVSTTRGVIDEMQRISSRQVEDRLARGKAMWEIVLQERELAEKEEQERRRKQREERELQRQREGGEVHVEDAVGERPEEQGEQREEGTARQREDVAQIRARKRKAKERARKKSGNWRASSVVLGNLSTPVRDTVW
ncbi:hypothetical protein QBC47DRAFT_385424 [Echria macrotheca]|uniref:Uncharacterized protein n=1 Tax=Echria macrotheca TaxID=438768 RepID=A0AAJ0BB12_9PEZI|nr:hypothetical protein QBC47DRAFT_385424 [Echria macrotheca]